MTVALPAAPGLYDFLDAVGGPAQLLHVRVANGVLVARFPVLGSYEVPVVDLMGEFRPTLHALWSAGQGRRRP
ncbi:hypothetical protein FN976_25630 [Caenimonas sedimenti]|uniref:Uncharacterized protein n=1 Tax=Caenimonas sedimenti TaxID=2596921 RepID=A0A562ZGQ9_9BURK|nr:hypothetical protein [Caenimonas sedimenti]TWO67769.1 hypothetical protein FN976_25630 [Caenimonas sedimenti]